MTTRDYEALVILKSTGTEQDIARFGVQLEESIKKLGGQLSSSQSLGRRKLAFRIARQVEGYYHLLRFQAPTARLDELKRLYYLNETIVRFIILNAEEVGPLNPARPLRLGATTSPLSPTPTPAVSVTSEGA